MVQETLSDNEKLGSIEDRAETADLDDASPDSQARSGNSAANQMTDNRDSSGSKSKDKPFKISLASPRYWHGMRLSTYLRLLASGGFRIHFLAIGMLVGVFCYAIANSVLSFFQWLLFSRRISKTKIENPPVFIVGHWRSGTTLVHELVNLDDQLKAPTTYECFVPSHFLISEWCMKPFVGWLMPKTRPMDNMPSGPARPNEDEFAICALGGPSPYSSLAFPNLPKRHQEMIDMVDVSDEDLDQLRQSILYFTKALTLKHGGKRLVLKSPTNTGRIEFLRKTFPGAKFLHIIRDPKDLIPSTIRLWSRLEQVNGFQIPSYDRSELEEYVCATFSRMYQAFDAASSNNDDDMITLRYEDLVSDPVANLRKAYDQLGLEGFDNVEPRLKEYMESQADYKKNEHQLNDRIRELINEKCASYQEKYGYAKV